MTDSVFEANYAPDAGAASLARIARMITLAEARERIEARLGATLPEEVVPLAASLGRCLARDYRAEQPWPQTDRSAMDGYGVRATVTGLAAGTALTVIGDSLAGHPFTGTVRDGEAVRIMTGAVVPAGVDAVVPVEDTSGFGAPRVTLHTAIGRGANIRPQGSEVAVGDLLLARGRRLRAAEIGALAVLGIDPVPVVRRPRVAILSTGDEVVPIDVTPADHQVRDSNAWALAAQVIECGGAPLALGIARDERADLEQRLRRGLAEADVVLTIGGVSKGTHDLVHGTLADLGVQEVFHGIALKPGKPTFFGVCDQRGATVHVFGLPGNPASCFTVFDLLVAPLLRARCGEALAGVPARAQLAGAPFVANRRLQAVPARLRWGVDGICRAELAPPAPSGDPFSLLAGDGYVLLPEGAQPSSASDAEVRLYTSGVDRL